MHPKGGSVYETFVYILNLFFILRLFFHSVFLLSVGVALSSHAQPNLLSKDRWESLAETPLLSQHLLNWKKRL